MATNAAKIDGNQAALQTALDDAIAAGMAPKCAAAVRARKLIRQLQKQAAAAAKQTAKKEQAKAEAARGAERLAAKQPPRVIYAQQQHNDEVGKKGYEGLTAGVFAGGNHSGLLKWSWTLPFFALGT